MADPTIVLNYVYCGACRCTRLVPPCPCECHVDSVRAAAPDLLAALIAIVKVIDRADDRECPAAALEMARAAIKKAEGRSNG